MGSEEDDNRNKRQRRVEGATRKHRSGKKDKSRDKESCISTPNAIPLKAWCELLDAKILIILACCFVSEKKSKDKQKDKHDKVALLSRGHRSPSWDYVEEFFLSLRVLWESAREMFSRYIKAWNNQTLESQYYEGIVNRPRSARKWKIKA
ncbi:hypothetical protein FEM48_Zijuj05G0036000 [Ziziphus jujuba var. spinosa]|uniref:Uncharacterized protein n=1 Tax=Ziziphus jujuba var. spinosa TaxID=714518 RepID=A0A978VCL1_ZIZJJ|nr:hypothetical protein FEM48_Zijuj05G0036000 [Ziziphus jujuba var. spinosa]